MAKTRNIIAGLITTVAVGTISAWLLRRVRESQDVELELAETQDGTEEINESFDSEVSEQ